uniref:A to I editase domain-containing protein n=1 Tax=Hyaloperonospora arabidopsidis (strain Emoy2) TaxID=559515 RepID=M4BAQ7_HYAAE
MPSPADVAQVVLQWFESSSQCQKKIPPAEWTVLAAIVLHTRALPSQISENTASVDSLRVLTAATGNKCLGSRDLNADGFVVNDCHAEVLTRRAFLRYLYMEALAWQENGLEANEQSIFERSPTSGRLVLRPRHTLHLFISEAPCGDAAIYELREDVVDQLVQQRAARSSCKIGAVRNQFGLRSDLRLTGAKRLRCSKSHDSPVPDKRFAQAISVARVKSGRSDLPPDKQTLSMSCSDKLAKWNALGLQGSLLLQWFEPIFLSSIVVSKDNRAKSVAVQDQALKRAVCLRLEQRGAMMEGARLSVCEARVISDAPQFSRCRTPNRAPSSVALNWTVEESFWARGDKPKLALKSMGKLDGAAKVFNSFGLEVLMAATGFKQGAQKPSKMDQVAMEKVASRLSKRNLLRAFHLVLSKSSPLDAVRDLEYLQLKHGVPFDAAAPSACSAPTASVSFNDRRQRFFAVFSDWVGVPARFKQFKL